MQLQPAHACGPHTRHATLWQSTCVQLAPRRTLASTVNKPTGMAAGQDMRKCGHKLIVLASGMQDSPRPQNKGQKIKSEYVGVSWEAQRNRWRASIQFNDKTYNLGRFDVEEDAARAHDLAVLRLEEEGKLAKGERDLNFPEDSYSQQTIMSAKLPSDTVRQISSEYRGVHWDEGHQKYRAVIYIGGKRKYLGRFDKAEDAALAYQDAYKQALAEGKIKARKALQSAKPPNAP